MLGKGNFSLDRHYLPGDRERRTTTRTVAYRSCTIDSRQKFAKQQGAKAFTEVAENSAFAELWLADQLLAKKINFFVTFSLFARLHR